MRKAVIVSCFDWYDKRIKKIADSLSTGYEVLIITSDFDHISKTYFTDSKPETKYVHVRKYKSNISPARIRSHLGFTKAALKEIEAASPDLIYALVPLNSLAQGISNYKSLHSGVKVIFDIIDMWPESMPVGFARKLPFFGKWQRMRNESLANADFVATECDLYQKYLLSYIKCPFTTLPLYKEVSKDFNDKTRELILSNKSENPEHVVLGYVGSINNIIDIDSVIGVTKYFLNKGSVTLKIIGDGENRNKLINSLKETGAEVLYYGRVFDEERKREILVSCDYALNLMVSSVKVGLSIKSIDYFSLGLPIINNVGGDTHNMVEDANLGININSPDDLVNLAVYDSASRLKILDYFNEHFTDTAFERKLISYLKETGLCL